MTHESSSSDYARLSITEIVGHLPIFFLEGADASDASAVIRATQDLLDATPLDRRAEHITTLERVLSTHIPSETPVSLSLLAFLGTLSQYRTTKGITQELEKAIKDGAALYRPEIVVLTDEDSSTDGVKSSQIPGTRVHGFAMEVANPKLVAFARSTGGAWGSTSSSAKGGKYRATVSGSNLPRR